MWGLHVLPTPRWVFSGPEGSCLFQCLMLEVCWASFWGVKSGELFGTGSMLRSSKAGWLEVLCKAHGTGELRGQCVCCAVLTPVLLSLAVLLSIGSTATLHYRIGFQPLITSSAVALELKVSSPLLPPPACPLNDQ